MVLALLLAGLYVAQAQDTDSSQNLDFTEDGLIGVRITVWPEYTGRSVEADVANGIQYPIDAKREGITGIVYVSFIVNELGEITKVKLIRGVHQSLDDEAIRVVSSLEKFEWPETDAPITPVQYTVPVQFRLN